MDIESFWEYSDPALSEERFRSAIFSATEDGRLELLTQIARTYSLRQRFAEAHDLLDQVESQLSAAGPRPRIHYHLERGRTHHSNAETEIARRKPGRILPKPTICSARTAGLSSTKPNGWRVCRLDLQVQGKIDMSRGLKTILRLLPLIGLRLGYLADFFTLRPLFSGGTAF